MEYINFGSTDMKVSRACLGTMTWGRQNTQEDANEQIDHAIAQGVNLIDTAELYAVPSTASTYGKTEEIIGNWINANPSKRSEIVLMSKIAGKGLSYIRKGQKYTGKDIVPAVDASLKRLQTDYIDVYQLHWPNRPNPNFGRHWIGKVDYDSIDPAQEEEEMIGILEAVEECIKAGKIRYCGVSNETPWGIGKYLELAKAHNLPKIVSVQNEFSLLQTKDWPYVTESCVLNELAYLPWSPLAAGALSGKYVDGNRPTNSRWTLVNRHGNFRDTENVNLAVKEYSKIAAKHGLTPSQMSLAWCNQFHWATSTIIGATSMTQLKENLSAFEQPLAVEVMREIEAVRRQYPIPF